MKIAEFNKRLCKIEAKKRQVNIAQMSEIVKAINKMTGGVFYALIKILPVIFFCLLISDGFSQNFPPRSYWHFDGVNPVNQIDDAYDIQNLSFAGGALTTTAGGQVLSYGDGDGATGALLSGGTMAAYADSFAFEFIFKAGPKFNTTRLFTTQNGNVNMAFVWATNSFTRPYISFYTRKTNGQVDDFQIVLDGVNRKNWGWLSDGAWHHIVFQYNSQTGNKHVYIDGQCPAGFSKVTATGGSFLATDNIYLLNTNPINRLWGDIDEMALYNRTLYNPATVQTHYNDMVSGTHYTYGALDALPVAADVVGAVWSEDYAFGHTQNTVSWTVPTGFLGPDGEPAGTAVTKIWSTQARNTIDQMKWFPHPRYKAGHTLLPTINGSLLNYLGGNGQTVPIITTPALYTVVSQAQKRANMVSIATLGAQKYNIAVHFDNINTITTQFTDLNTEYGQIAKLANDSSHFKLSAWILRAQNSPTVTNQSQPVANYMQNSAGQFLDQNGNVTTGTRIIRINNATAQYNADGLNRRNTFTALINALPNRSATKKLDLIADNGEWHPVLKADLFGTDVNKYDPVMRAAQISSGLDWHTWASRMYRNMAKLSYPDQFMNLPGLAQTLYQEYTVVGAGQFHWKWREYRDLQSPPVNADYLATPDYYFRYPYNWRNWAGAWHGIGWASFTRQEELLSGDDFDSPFVSAGWYPDEQKNMRPGQFLGLLKILNGMGAKYFYASYFGITQSPFPLPENYLWQLTHPSYAQACLSWQEANFNNSVALIGDYPLDYTATPQTDSSFLFYSGDLRLPVVVRKVIGAEKYLIFATIQNNTNSYDALSITKNATIALPGVGNMTFQARRQGSVYYFDNTNTAAPLFYQLDEFHEMKHPDKWSQDMIYEAELNAGGTATLATEGISGTNYTGAITYAELATGNTLTYTVQRSELSTGTRYFWIRAKSATGAPVGVTVALNTYASKSIECITSTSWAWYRVDKVSAVPISYTSMTSGAYVLSMTGINGILIDKIAFLESSADVYSAVVPVCSGSVVASITPSIASPFCSYDGPVTLTASVGSSYLWNTGATTQAISVAVSGTYTVTVTVGGTGSDDDIEVVTIEGAPVISPIANITNACPEDSASYNDITVVNTGTAGTLTWHLTKADAIANSAAQGDSITATGVYYARITAGATLGCYDHDSVKVTIVTCACATPPTVYAGADKTICSGSNIAMTGTKGVGTGTTTWSGGAGSFSIPTSLTATYFPAAADITAGFVDLTLTTADPDAGGPCVGMTDVVRVFISTPTTPTITVNGTTTFCSGQSRTLTATAATSYLWSSGATTQAITVTTTGTHTVTITNASGCTSSTSSSVIVQAVPSVNLNASVSSVCTSGSIVMSVSPNTSYLWSTGAVTQSITETQPATYSVTVTNSFGCTASSSVTITNSCAGIGCVAPYNMTVRKIGWWKAEIHFSATTPDQGFELVLSRTGKVITAPYNKETRIIYLYQLRWNTLYSYYIIAKCATGDKRSVTQTFKTTGW